MLHVTSSTEPSTDILHQNRPPTSQPTSPAALDTMGFPKIYNTYFVAIIATVGGMLVCLHHTTPLTLPLKTTSTPPPASSRREDAVWLAGWLDPGLRSNADTLPSHSSVLISVP